MIFAVFVLILCLSNIGLLVQFFSNKEKTALKEQVIVVAGLDFNDSAAVIESLTSINEKYNFDVEIYTSTGSIIYTTHGSQMMDYFSLKNDKFVIFRNFSAKRVEKNFFCEIIYLYVQKYAMAFFKR